MNASLTLAPVTALTLRAGRPADATDCGRICYEAFAYISNQHNFPPDFPSAEVATGLMEMLFSHPATYSVVAEADGRIVGSNFLWEHGPIAGVGPITVDVDAQNSAIGRKLMTDVLHRADQRKFSGVRLVQAGFHCRSLSLYTKLGFDVREPLVCFQGAPLQAALPGLRVRPATTGDLAACNAVCEAAHGHTRGRELEEAIARGIASVVERNGAITGYTTSIGFFGHSVARTTDDLKALIAAAKQFDGPGFLLPTRNSDLFRWCLAQGLRVTQPLNLMSRGFYQQPIGAFLPSILF